MRLSHGTRPRTAAYGLSRSLVVQAHDGAATTEKLQRRAYTGEFQPTEPVDIRIP
jgi:hypothetical protein